MRLLWKEVYFLTDCESIALRNAVNLAKQTNTEILRDAQGLPSELWIPRTKPVEPIPSPNGSLYSYLVNSIPPNSSNQYEPGASLSQSTIPSAHCLGVPGSSSSRAARADPPAFSTHSHPDLPTHSCKKVTPDRFAKHGNDVDEDEPPSDFLEQEDSEGDVDKWNDDVHRDEMTRIAMELRKVDLTSLKSEKTGGFSRCC